jgi:RNA:NAD 2'-phosphotransferase (TPT1/KptA family)
MDVNELLSAFERAGKTFTLEVLVRVVTKKEKQSFGFTADRLQIRRRQGHSVEVDPDDAA